MPFNNLYNKYVRGKNIANLPENLALDASVELALFIAKKSNAPEQITAMIQLSYEIAHIGINGFDDDSTDIVKCKKILLMVNKFRKTNGRNLSPETETKIEDAIGVLSGAIEGGTRGAIKNKKFSTSQIVAGLVLGALDGALAEVDGFNELKSAVKVANRMLELTSNPLSFKLEDLAHARLQLSKIRKHVNNRMFGNQETMSFLTQELNDVLNAPESINSDLNMTNTNFTKKEIRMTVNHNDLSQHNINANTANELVKNVFEGIAAEQGPGRNADSQYFHKNAANGSYELYDNIADFNTAKLPIATCHEPTEQNKPYTIRIPLPVGAAVGPFFNTLTAKGLSFQIRHCPSAIALDQLISNCDPGTITITAAAQKKLINRYTPPSSPPDTVSLDTLLALLNKIRPQAPTSRAHNHHLKG